MAEVRTPQKALQPQAAVWGVCLALRPTTICSHFILQLPVTPDPDLENPSPSPISHPCVEEMLIALPFHALNTSLPWPTRQLVANIN